MNEEIWIRYLIKKGIIRKGLRNFENNEKEIKEFKQMLYRLNKKECSKKGDEDDF